MRGVVRMLTGTLVFLVIGAIGVAVLALGLIGGHLLGLLSAGFDAAVSTETIAGFLGVFGFGAAVTSSAIGANGPGGLVVSGAVGLAAAIPATFLVARLSRAARDMPTDDTPSRADLLGALGVVVTRIPAEGYGEVRVRLGGHQFKLNARADQPIGTGASVLVIEVPSDTSAVVIETPGVPGVVR
jgi:membrane protein implicated in regulation of membrane protease activity